MRLQTKIIVLVCSIIVVLAIITIHYSGKTMYKTMMSEQLDHGEFIAVTASEHLITKVINRDKVLVHKEIQNMTEKLDAVLFVYITDFDGVIFSHSFETGFPRDLSVLVADLSKETGMTVRKFGNGQFSVQEISKPLIEGMRARIFIGVTDEHVNRHLENFKKRVSMYIFMAAVLAIMVSIVFSRKISAPIEELIEAVQSFGDMKVGPPLISKGACDEVDRLDVAFNNMAEARNKARLELQQHRDNLEELVEERTTELTVTNTRLKEEVKERKSAVEQKEKLILELKGAMAEIKVLSDFLPICASCKKIRDDKGYWEQIDSYISTHTNTKFSHSICPECTTKLYPDYADKIF